MAQIRDKEEEDDEENQEQEQENEAEAGAGAEGGAKDISSQRKAMREALTKAQDELGAQEDKNGAIMLKSWENFTKMLLSAPDK